VVWETGVEIVPYLSRPATCHAEVLRLLRMGTGEQRRLIATVSQDRRLVISAAPLSGEADWVVDAEGRYYDARHNQLMPGIVPVGRWLRSQGVVRFLDQESLKG